MAWPKYSLPIEKADVNVEYMYAFADAMGEKAVLVFRFDDPDAAISTLCRGGNQRRHERPALRPPRSVFLSLTKNLSENYRCGLVRPENRSTSQGSGTG